MFSFHKPKIYRSINGCCVCRAKSSSSRFTDSKKYETEFERCFLIKNEIRSGEICNACVLLVKRCKKLPKESTKHWAHVVDARQGHKSNNKPKTQSTIVSSPSRSVKQSSSSISEKKEQRKVCEKLLNPIRIVNENEPNNVMNKDDELVQNTSTSTSDECDCSSCAYNRELDEKTSSNIRRLKKTSTPKKLCTESTSSSGHSSDSNEEDDDYMSDDEKANNEKMITRKSPSSFEQATEQRMSSKSKNKRKFAVKHMQRNESTFLDMNYWRREQVCCGIIFRNKSNDMVLIDSKLFTPCACRKKIEQQKQEKLDIESKQMDVDESIDTNNNNLLDVQSTVDVEEITEKITVNLDDLNTLSDEQIPINELVVNTSSGISSDSSDDILSITEEEDSNSSSNNLISDHNLLAKNIITTNRTFGVL